MTEESKLETIRQKLIKLQAVINCPAASDGEKCNAAFKRDALLKAHGLTEDDLRANAKLSCVIQWGKQRWARKLMIQCAAWLLEENPVNVVRMSSSHMVIDLTPLDAADLRGCYSYYEGLMEGQLSLLKAQAKDLKKQHDRELAAIEQRKKDMLGALILRYELGAGPAKDKPTRDMTRKEMEDAERQWRQGKQFRGEAWQRGEKLDGGQGVLGLTF